MCLAWCCPLLLWSTRDQKDCALIHLNQLELYPSCISLSVAVVSLCNVSSSFSFTAFITLHLPLQVQVVCTVVCNNQPASPIGVSRGPNDPEQIWVTSTVISENKQSSTDCYFACLTQDKQRKQKITAAIPNTLSLYLLHISSARAVMVSILCNTVESKMKLHCMALHVLMTSYASPADTTTCFLAVLVSPRFLCSE